MSYGKEQARWIYKTMNEIRYFEEKVRTKFSVMVKFLVLSIYMLERKQLQLVSCHNLKMMITSRVPIVVMAMPSRKAVI